MKVYLIGAGPGDPELITIKGLRLLESADVVIYDSLIAPDLLDMANPDAERIFVGKRAGHHSKKQEEINEILIAKANESEIVVRLKGGDPFVFGRGGEEASALFRAGIPFEVVPGITAATGVGAYNGIPLTDRRQASQVILMSACHANLDPDRHDWAMLATFKGTIVIYMGTRHLSFVVNQLAENGMSPDMLVSVIQSGTTPSQKTVTAPLSSIVDDAEVADIAPPALIVIGEVNRLRNELDWLQLDAANAETC